MNANYRLFDYDGSPPHLIEASLVIDTYPLSLIKFPRLLYFQGKFYERYGVGIDFISYAQIDIFDLSESADKKDWVTYSPDKS